MSSALRRLIAGGCTVVLLIVGVQLLGTTAASAHSNNGFGHLAACQSNGTYTVTWTITNDYDLTETATVNSHVPSGSSLSANSVNIDQEFGRRPLGDHHPDQHRRQRHLGLAERAGSLVGQLLPGRQRLGDPRRRLQADRPADRSAVGQRQVRQQLQPGVAHHHDPARAGVSYTIDNQQRNAGTYQVSPGQHTVEATSTTLTLLKPTSWTFTLDAAPGDCNTETTPVVPTVTQSKCDSNHQPTNPTLNLPSTLGITYSVNKRRRTRPARPCWSPRRHRPATSSRTSRTTRGRSWTRRPRRCRSPSTPRRTASPRPRRPVRMSTQSVCNGTTPSNPTLDFPNTPGIDYTTDKRQALLARRDGRGDGDAAERLPLPDRP